MEETNTRERAISLKAVSKTIKGKANIARSFL